MVFAFSLAANKEPITMQAKGELDALADADASSTDSEVRYFGYAARLRTALRTAHRYIAYVRFYTFFQLSSDAQRTSPTDKRRR